MKAKARVIKPHHLSASNIQAGDIVEITRVVPFISIWDLPEDIGGFVSTRNIEAGCPVVRLIAGTLEA